MWDLRSEIENFLLNCLRVRKDRRGRVWMRGFYGDVEIKDLDRLCLACGAYGDDCGTDCPGTTDVEREIAAEILASLLPEE